MRASQVRNLYPVDKLPFYLLAPLSLLAVFIALTAALSLVARQSSPPVNPFASFSDLLPGQPETVLEARGMTDRSPIYSLNDAVPEKYYDLTPTEGFFERIRVTVYGGTISQIDFILRENSLRLGDLAGMLGVYDYRVRANLAYFLMSDHVIIAKTVQNHHHDVSPFVSVLSVTIAETDMTRIR